MAISEIVLSEIGKKNILNSISAFNVSNNCDHSSPEAFYNSYIARKKQVIEGKVSALKNGAAVNKKKLNWELYILEQVKVHKDFALEVIIKLSNTKVQNKERTKYLERADKLLKD